MSVSVKLAWHGEVVSDAAHEAGMRALYLGGEHIREESARIVPHDEGILESDAEVLLDRADDAVHVSYGNGPAAAYAEVQHEETGFKHQQGREAKYLEKALNERGDAVIDFVADAIRRELGM